MNQKKKIFLRRLRSQYRIAKRGSCYFSSHKKTFFFFLDQMARAGDDKSAARARYFSTNRVNQRRLAPKAITTPRALLQPKVRAHVPTRDRRDVSIAVSRRARRGDDPSPPRVPAAVFGPRAKKSSVSILEPSRRGIDADAVARAARSREPRSRTRASVLANARASFPRPGPPTTRRSARALRLTATQSLSEWTVQHLPRPGVSCGVGPGKRSAR